ncbi:MAG: alpha/beta hydrolase-fold protein [Planctomycetota bacterium]|nr:alpha/beta hydrolase-fold protein [Planctomycetota bacterium]MDA1105826.1 alpha/beta hydrolase-fold protein [Planctomycetota bacterium]
MLAAAVIVALGGCVLAQGLRPAVPPTAQPNTDGSRGSAADGVPAAAPPRLLPIRPTPRELAEIPADQRDEVLVGWGVESPDGLSQRTEPEPGRVIVYFEAIPAAATPAVGDVVPWPRLDPLIMTVGGAPASLGPEGTLISSLGSWWPTRPEDLTGTFRVRAILDTAGSPDGIGDGGSLVAPPVIVQMDATQADQVRIDLGPRLPSDEPPSAAGIVVMEVPASSPSGAARALRAAVVLPTRHTGTPDGLSWPVVLVIPDVGEDWRLAETLARPIRAGTDAGILPQAIWVVLEARTPLGHHALLDSPLHGAYESALVESLLPALEARLGASKDPNDRVAIGVGLGGWSALRLAAARPDVVSAVFVVSPELPRRGVIGEVRLPGLTDAADAGDAATPVPDEQAAEVAWLSPGTHRVLTTAQDEFALARILAPGGGSGRRLDAWRSLPLKANDLRDIVDAGWLTAAEPISQSWAVIPSRDEHLCRDGGSAFFEWFDERCAEEARQGRSPPSGRGGVIPAGEVPRALRWSVLLSALGPEIRSHFRVPLLAP